MSRTLDFSPGAGTGGGGSGDGFPLTADADFATYKGINLGAPTNPNDAATKTYADALVTALKAGAPAGGDTLNELDARIAVVEALGSLATDAELVAAVVALLGSADTAGDTLGELQALIGLRLLKSANLSDVANPATALANLGGAPLPTAAEAAYYAERAVLLEPLAIEPLQAGAFSYVIGSSVTKYLLASWGTRLGASGRLDMREAVNPVPLRGVTVTGTNPGGGASTGAFIDPTLPDYDDPKETYFERIAEIAASQTRYCPVVGGGSYAPLLPGPYGNILVSFTFHDTAWLGLVNHRGPAGSLLPIHDEISDAAEGDLRMSRKLYMPVTKNIAAGLLTGAAGGPQAVESGMTYIICPADWGKVADPLAPYDFRDDFMGASLDTASKWTRSQSTAGNVEINPDFAACKLRGNGNWGDNGIFAQAGHARATGLTFLIDVLVRAQFPNLVVGFHDGAGQSFSDFSHGLYFTTDGGVTPTMYVFENGNNRGAVGASYTANCLYRVRITLSATSTVAVYEIQGGTQYPAIGAATWTTLTPGTPSSSASSPLHAGATVQSANDNYISDPRIYS